MLPSRKWVQENKKAAKKVTKGFGPTARAIWRATVKEQERSAMVLIETEVLVRLGVIDHTGPGDRYVDSERSTLTVVVREARHGAKVCVRASGGVEVEDGGVLFFLEKGCTLEEDVREHLAKYSCPDVDGMEHSLERVKRLALEFARHPFNRPPELQAWLEEIFDKGFVRPKESVLPSNRRGVDVRQIPKEFYTVTLPWNDQVVLLSWKNPGHEWTAALVERKTCYLIGVNLQEAKRTVKGGCECTGQRPDAPRMWQIRNIKDKAVASIIRERILLRTGKTQSGLNCVPAGWSCERLIAEPKKKRWRVCAEAGGLHKMMAEVTAAAQTELTLEDALAVATASLDLVVACRHLIGATPGKSAAQVLAEDVKTPLKGSVDRFWATYAEELPELDRLREVHPREAPPQRARASRRPPTRPCCAPARTASRRALSADSARTSSPLRRPSSAARGLTAQASPRGQRRRRARLEEIWAERAANWKMTRERAPGLWGTEAAAAARVVELLDHPSATSAGKRGILPLSARAAEVGGARSVEGGARLLM